MLEIRNLTASIGGNQILNGINLTVKEGEVHAIMGPNGSGKSTLSNVLAGHPQYVVESGEALMDGVDLLGMPAEERSRAGVFLCFQHPIEIPGVRLDQFLRAGYNAIHKSRGLEELDPIQFDRLLQQKAGIVNMGAVHAEAQRQLRLLRRRKEAQRDPSDGDAGTPALHPRRAGLRPRRGLAAAGRRRHQ